MVLIACTLYLPEHIAMIVRRAYYYALGDAEHVPSKLAPGFSETSLSLSSSLSDVVSVAAQMTSSAAHTVPEAVRATASVVGGGVKSVVSSASTAVADAAREVVGEL